MKGFWGAVFLMAEDAVNNCVSEPLSVDAVAAKRVGLHFLIVPVAKYLKHEVEKNSLGKVNTKERFAKLTQPVEEKKVKVGGGIPTTIIDLARASGPPMDISDS